MNVAAVVGIGGVWGIAFLALLKKRPLLPTNQVYMLPEGHDDHEHDPDDDECDCDCEGSDHALDVTES